MPGDDWTQKEVDATIKTYIKMLSKELSGKSYVKARHRHDLAQKLGERSEGAVEYKFQNTSAVLDELGYPHIQGYTPRRNYQQLLKERIIEMLNKAGDLHSLLDKIASAKPAESGSPKPFGASVTSPPKDLQQATQSGRSATRRVNYIDRERRNQELGKAGEEHTLSLEKQRLNAQGKPGLAKKVEWVSETEGDGLGYDILSFEASGVKRYIEVKTTAQGKTLPFYVTRRELEASKDLGSQYYLYRLFHFNEMKRRALFILNGALTESCHLSPESYLCVPDS